MKKYLAILLLVLFAGCDGGIYIDLGGMGLVPSDARPAIDYPAWERTVPTIDLELALRQENWLGDQNEGSCVHASMISLLRWQGHDDLADAWQGENGEYPSSFAAQLDAAGIRYAMTVGENDVSFLEWSIRTRRGANVTCRGARHMITLVDLTETTATILDNNSVSGFQTIPRAVFLQDWFTSNSWGITPVYTPPPMRPFR